MRVKTLCSLLLALLLVPSLQAVAESKGGEGEAAAPKVTYVALYPPLVGNYGSGGPRLKYYKADISLRVPSPEAKALVEANDPLLRNQLIMLFSQQTDDSLGSVEAKEALRQEALKELRQVMEQETGEAQIDDLLFNNLIVQP